MEDAKHPKPDVKIQDYPDIPEGSYLNFNDKTGTFQVYTYGRDANGKRIKISIGTINRDLTFSFSDLYVAKQKVLELQQKIEALKELLKSNGVDIVEEVSDRSTEVLKEEIEKPEEKIDNTEAILEVSDSNPQTAQGDEFKELATQVDEKLGLDASKERHIVLPFEELACIAMMSSLGSYSDAYSMSRFYFTHRDWLEEHLFSPELPNFISHDIFRAHLAMLNPNRFEEFYSELIRKFLLQNYDKLRIADFNGQPIPATSKNEDNGPKYSMNDFDTGVMLRLYRKPTLNKKKEVPVGFWLLDGIDIRGAVVVANISDVQIGFANSALKAGADYCLAVKDDDRPIATELTTVFNAVHSDHVKVYDVECERGFGKTAQRTVKVIPGRFLSKFLKSSWEGLAEGCAVRTTLERTNKRSRRRSIETTFYLSSLSGCECKPEAFDELGRRHYLIETKMRWLLDCNFLQNSSCGSSTNYLSNLSALNTLAQGILYRYQEWLSSKGDAPPSNQLRKRMTDPKSCLEAMAIAFGLTHQIS